MPEPTPVHADRRRAQAFGAVAEDYERYRPRYPQALIDRIVTRRGLRVLDVGAGTGISSAQLAAAGAEVLAVEPYDRMADICVAKGIAVERDRFEPWDDAGRRFDAVVFGQSFHWVAPDPALPKIASILSPGGSLVLMWNRVVPVQPSRAELDRIYDDYPVAAQSSPADAATEALFIEQISAHGFTVERAEYAEDLHYGCDDWLGMTATHSNQLIMEPESRTELLDRLRNRIGAAGVTAANNALALFCTTAVAG